MATTLRASPTPTSLHVGFIRAGSCDTSTRGGACGIVAHEQFLRSEWCHTVDNFAGAYEQTFACLGISAPRTARPPSRSRRRAAS